MNHIALTPSSRSAGLDGSIAAAGLDNANRCSTFVLMQAWRGALAGGAHALRQPLSPGNAVYAALRLSQAA